jgi:RNA polymerase-interacting CarD/CdnL/TRCF family regulator
MTLRVPTRKVANVGMRKLSDPDRVELALRTLSKAPQVSTSNWSEQAQEYDNKINSGDILKLAEVVRDLFTQYTRSYNKRGLYTAALGRLSLEVSLVTNESQPEVIERIERCINERSESTIRPFRPGMLANDLAFLRNSLQGGEWRVDGNTFWRVYEAADQLDSGTKVLLKIECSFSKDLSGEVYNQVNFYLQPYLCFQRSRRPLVGHLTKPPYSIGLIADGTGKGTEADPIILGGILEVLASSVENEEETAMFSVHSRAMRTCLRALMAGSDLTFSISDYESDTPIKLRLRLPNTNEFSRLYDRMRRTI